MKIQNFSTRQSTYEGANTDDSFRNHSFMIITFARFRSKLKRSFEIVKVSVAMGELRRIGSERLSLEQALLPGESPTTSPDMSPGSTEGDLAAPPRGPARSATSRDSVRMLIDQVRAASRFFHSGS